MDVFFNIPQYKNSSITLLNFNSMAWASEFRMAVACLLRSRFGRFLAFYAIRCGSWTAVNEGTSNRAPCASVGFDEYASVSQSNAMLERTLNSTHSFCPTHDISFRSYKSMYSELTPMGPNKIEGDVYRDLYRI